MSKRLCKKKETFLPEYISALSDIGQYSYLGLNEVFIFCPGVTVDSRNNRAQSYIAATPKGLDLKPGVLIKGCYTNVQATIEVLRVVTAWSGQTILRGYEQRFTGEGDLETLAHLLKAYRKRMANISKYLDLILSIARSREKECLKILEGGESTRHEIATAKEWLEILSSTSGIDGMKADCEYAELDPIGYLKTRDMGPGQEEGYFYFLKGQ